MIQIDNDIVKDMTTIKLKFPYRSDRNVGIILPKTPDALKMVNATKEVLSEKPLLNAYEGM